MTFLLECSLRAALITAIGLGMTSLLRRASAAMRHSLLTAAVVCAAVLPILMVAAPKWNLELPAEVRDVPVVRSLVTHAELGSEATTPSAALRWASPAFVDAAATPPLEEGNNTIQTNVLFLGWAAGASLILIVLFAGWIRLACIARKSTPVYQGNWIHIAQRVGREYRLRRAVCLLQSRHPAILATWGIWRPKVVLPSGAEGWSEDRIEVVLRHELAHVRRNDWLIQMLSELLRAVYWFNPLVWAACARMRRESEQAADDTVLNSGVAGSEYAAHLLDLARTFRGPRYAWSPALLMARESTLEQRFKALLNPDINRRALTRLAVTMTAIVFLGVTFPLAGLKVSAQEMLSLELPVRVLRAPFEFVTQTMLPQPSGSGSIEGLVWDLGTGEPLHDVHVELNKPGERASVQTVTTGRDGKFELRNVPPGNYQVVAAREGGYLPAQYGQRSAIGRGLTITVGAGQKLTNIYLSMMQPGSISGRVLDRDGEPVGRAQVQATRTVYMEGRRAESMVASVATDDRGAYRLYWLPPGQYRVGVTPQAPGRGWVPIIPKSLETPATFYTLISPPVITRRVLGSGEIQEEIQVSTYFPGTPDLAAATPIEIRPGAHVNGVDITVVPPARTYRIRGILISATTGQPVAGAEVRATPVANGGSMQGASGGTSDRNGRFEISGVLPGPYMLTATAAVGDDRNAEAGSLAVTLGANDLENISIAVSPGFDIPVKVTIEGRPAGGGITLRLQSVPALPPFGGFVGMRPGTPTRNLLTTSEFKLEGVKTGDYRLSFLGMGNGRGVLPAYVKSVRMGPVDVLNGLLSISGPVDHALEIVLSANMSTLEGLVVNDTQEPLANVSVAVIPDLPNRARADLFKTGNTDAAGRFQISGIAPGSYRVFSWENVEGFPWQDAEWLRPFEGRGRPVHFGEGVKENIRLTVIR